MATTDALVAGELAIRESLFSPLWYRVANLKPVLPLSVTAHGQRSRNEAWHVLVNGTTGCQFRINHRAYQFIGCCDGRHTVQQIWDELLQRLQDDAPTQDEIVRLLTQLAKAGVIDCGVGFNFEVQAKHRSQEQRRRRGMPNPLAFRVPFGDPSWLLGKLEWLCPILFHPLSLWLWLGGILLAMATAVSHWSVLSIHASTHMGTPHYLFLAWISFPFIKALHELGHALAVRHWGGEVHETGLAMFVLTPAPYVDASASAAFRRRTQRAGVAAMGVMVELAIAAFALLLWLNVQPGVVRDLAFVTLFVASVSTLAFNANPLLRFDAYYVLADLLDLPNLATRSSRYWTRLIQCAVFGTSGIAPMQALRGERKWLLIYAPLSWLYRVFISSVIVLWVGQWSLVLGAMIAIFAFVSVIVLPLLKLLRSLFDVAPSLRWRARIAVAGVVVACCVLGVVVPLPFSTTAVGVVWLPEQARARPQTDGFITRFAVRDGEAVLPGQLLLTLDDPTLYAQRENLFSQLRGLRAERFDQLGRDNAKAKNFDQDVARFTGDLLRVEERIDQLQVRSQLAGTFVMPRQQDLLGTYAKRGSTLGYVLDRKEISVRAAVPERDAALIRQRNPAVEVRLAEAVGQPVVAGLIRDVPAAVYELPSPALGDRGGGPYATDPADKDGVRTVEPVVLIDLALPASVLERVGGRVWVRFDHGAQPLAVQSWRRLQQLFLQHFNPTGG